MSWLSRRKERKAEMKRIQDATPLLPGNVGHFAHIEKALTFPTATGKPNPFLYRLDPEKKIPWY